MENKLLKTADAFMKIFMSFYESFSFWIIYFLTLSISNKFYSLCKIKEEYSKKGECNLHLV